MIIADVNDMLFEEIDDQEILNGIESLPTEDDLPCDDGVPMETARHRDQMNLLIDSLKAYWKDSRRYYTGGNMFLHFDISNKRQFRGPDFFLVMDADNRERKSWVVWQEGMRFPDVIIELLSDSTRKTDKGEKKELYEKIFRTPEYYIYDPFSQEFAGYSLSGNFYKTVPPDRESRIYSPITGLYLVIKNGWLRWMTKDGYILPSHEELYEREKQRAEQEKQRAEQEKQRAEQAEKRLMGTAGKMLAKGYSVSEIVEITGLSPDIITDF
jgi:Uma2 family endonuclease